MWWWRLSVTTAFGIEWQQLLSLLLEQRLLLGLPEGESQGFAVGELVGLVALVCDPRGLEAGLAADLVVDGVGVGAVWWMVDSWWLGGWENASRIISLGRSVAD